MAIAVEKELVVAGFINKHPDGHVFSLKDVDNFRRLLWNAGCGALRLNFTQQEMDDFLSNCSPIILKIGNKFVIKKDSLKASERNIKVCGSEENAKSYDLLIRMGVVPKADEELWLLYDFMGYRFLHEKTKP